MKRKRFIKLLMAAGYSRNQAEREAIEVMTAGIPYMIRFAYVMFVTKFTTELLRMWELPRARSIAVTMPHPVQWLGFEIAYDADEMYQYMRDQDGEETKNEPKALC